MTHDPVNCPAHYTKGKIEVRLFVQDQENVGLSHNLCSALEYICRAPHKGNAVQDIEKAIVRLTWEIERLEELEGDR